VRLNIVFLEKKNKLYYFYMQVVVRTDTANSKTN